MYLMIHWFPFDIIPIFMSVSHSLSFNSFLKLLKSQSVYIREKTKKAQCPNGLSHCCLKACVDQLAPIFTRMFNSPLEKCPSHLQMCGHHPGPQETLHHRTQWLRPVAPTFVLMKYLERLVLNGNKNRNGEKHYWPPPGCLAVCLKGKQVSRLYIQSVCALHPATPGQP